MRSNTWIIVALVMGGVGAYLLVEERPPSGESRWRPTQHRIEDTQEQLAALAERLQQYKKSHGRYPTMDEGLGVLDNFAVRLPVTQYACWPKGGAASLYSSDGGDRLPHDVWCWVRREIRTFRQEHGRLPRTNEELRQASRWYGGREEATSVPADLQVRAVQWEVAITDDGSPFLINDSGVLTRLQLPFVYENRNGESGDAFADSPADDDVERLFSVKVDEGVFVWSADGKQLAGAIGPAPWHTLARQRWLGGFLIVAAIGCVWRLVPWGYRASAGSKLIVSVIVGAGVNIALTPSCYVMIFGTSVREPVQVSRRVELLERYRAAGAISDETYAKSMKAMGVDSGVGAATRPGDGEGPDGE